MAINAVSSTVDKFDRGDGVFSTGQNKIYVPTIHSDIRAVFDDPEFEVELEQDGVTYNPFVHRSINHDTGFTVTNYSQEDNHWVKFHAQGTVEVRAKLAPGGSAVTVVNCGVLPIAANITPTFVNDTATFKITEPGYYALYINDYDTIDTRGIEGAGDWDGVGEIPVQTSKGGSGLPYGTVTKKPLRRPLFFFVMPIETSQPTAADVTYYYGPGLHNIGKETYDDGSGNVQRLVGGLKLTSNDTVYIHPEACIRGCLYTVNANPSNIRIYGTGTVTARGFTLTDAELAIFGNYLVSFGATDNLANNGTNNYIEGVTMVDSIRACATGINEMNIQHTQSMTWEHRQDGLAPGTNSVVNKNFVKSRDDLLKLYRPGIRGADNDFWQMTGGSPCKFAWQASEDVYNIYLKNSRVWKSDVISDWGADETERPDYRSTNAIFSGMGIRDGVYWGGNAIIDGFDVEEEYLYRVMGIRAATTNTQTDGSLRVWGSLSGDRGYEDIFIHGLRMRREPHKPVCIFANKGSTARKIWFEDWEIDGVKQTSVANTTSSISGDGFILATSPSDGGSPWTDPPPDGVTAAAWSYDSGSNAYTSPGTYAMLGFHTQNNDDLPLDEYEVTFTTTNTVRLKTRNLEDTGHPPAGGVDYGAGTHTVTVDVVTRGLAFDDRGIAGTILSDISVVSTSGASVQEGTVANILVRPSFLGL